MGMQYQQYHQSWVAPFAGAWIEILCMSSDIFFRPVAPFAGAWIEISRSGLLPAYAKVAPFAGAWIEIKMYLKIYE